MTPLAASIAALVGWEDRADLRHLGHMCACNGYRIGRCPLCRARHAVRRGDADASLERIGGALVRLHERRLGGRHCDCGECLTCLCRRELCRYGQSRKGRAPTGRRSRRIRELGAACCHGHPLDAENLITVQRPGGREQHICRACRAAAHERQRLKCA